MKSTALSVTNLNTGIPSLKGALLVKLDIFGMHLLMNAPVVKHPGKSLEGHVSVLHQKPNGMRLPNLAHAQSMLLVTIVFHVHLQEFGTLKQIPVNVLHQKLNGMAQHVIVLTENMDHYVFNAQLQDIGTIKQINALALLLLFGMEIVVFVLNHISFIREDVRFAQVDTN